MSQPAIDIDALKSRLKATWMAGDFGLIAKSYEAGAAEFVRRIGLVPGSRVLDVACGTGNLAVPAARTGAEVTGVDIATNLLEQARARAAAEGLTARFDEGDAEMLPYPDASFDAVISMFGVMFAPRPERSAAELLRVCRPGGRIALANWTPSGFVGQMFKTITTHVEFWRVYYGPTNRAFEALSAQPIKQAALRADLERLWTSQNHAMGGSTCVESEYLEVIAAKVATC